jgi:hypothetical protein
LTCINGPSRKDMRKGGGETISDNIIRGGSNEPFGNFCCWLGDNLDGVNVRVGISLRGPEWRWSNGRADRIILERAQWVAMHLCAVEEGNAGGHHCRIFHCR